MPGTNPNTYFPHNLCAHFLRSFCYLTWAVWVAKPVSLTVESDLMTMMLNCLPPSLKRTTCSPTLESHKAHWRSWGPWRVHRKNKTQSHKNLSLCFTHISHPYLTTGYCSLRIWSNAWSNRFCGWHRPKAWTRFTLLFTWSGSIFLLILCLSCQN